MTISFNRTTSRTPLWCSCKLILLLGLLAPAHGRAGGGHGPFPHGKGLGMGGVLRSRSSEPVSRPTASKIPPQVPLTFDGGAAGGSAVGRLAHGLPPPHGRRSAAADVPARLAQRLQRRRPNTSE